MKLKDLVKAEDTGNIILKEDAFQRGEEYYQVEPKWDRKIVEVNDVRWLPDENIFYKEFEVTKYGELMSEYRARNCRRKIKTKSFNLDGLSCLIIIAWLSVLLSCALVGYKVYSLI